MVKPTTIAPYTTRQHQRHGTRTIHEIAVIPMINAGTHNNHALAIGQIGGVGPLASKLQYSCCIDAGKYLLPCRCISRVLVLVVSRVITDQASIDAVLSHHQVVHGGDQLDAVAGLDFTDRDSPHCNRIGTPLNESRLNDIVVL